MWQSRLRLHLLLRCPLENGNDATPSEHPTPSAEGLSCHLNLLP